MKERYIELMEKALSAYTDEHIQRYFDDVRRDGLTEHGFPRLTADIGILIAHGRRHDLLPRFIEMMDFCCDQIPRVKAANDFSVREIICALWEVEESTAVPKDMKEMTERWRASLASIEPTQCYNEFATSPTDGVRNWALFSAVSEYFRQKAGLCDSSDFIELQLLQQLQWFDEKGMYQDKKADAYHQPIMYDLVPRGLFALLLDQGYRGEQYSVIDEILKKAALLTLDTQSPNGEMAYGGRSNQFVHNEAWMIAVYEYEAKRYAREGNTALAARFKAASVRALAVSEKWLSKDPILHIKNRFPTETKYGCERYAYFDKYMITVVSNLYAAYLICDDSIPFEETEDQEGCVASTSEHFHKLFVKGGGYGLEFDLNADPEYDANGLGRIQRQGAPSAICLACPCPSKPRYTVDIAPVAMSLCSATYEQSEWTFGAQSDTKYELVDSAAKNNSASAELVCRFDNGKSVREGYKVSKKGVSVKLRGKGKLGFALPAFCFDGETSPDIVVKKHSLSISYDGWTCRYTTRGIIIDTQKTAANRNGHYKVFLATGKNALGVKIEITQK